MRIYITIEGSVGNAIKNVLGMFGCCLCDDVSGADFIIVEDKKQLQNLFDENKFFAVFSSKEVEGLPRNTRWIFGFDFFIPIMNYFEDIKKELMLRSETNELVKMQLVVETRKEFAPQEIKKQSQHILVIDDAVENLQLALDLLGKDHFVTLASGYGEGLDLVRVNRYDVVLSDCQMAPETTNSALSAENIEIGKTVHNGIFFIFLATRRGAKVAIVTNANHHQDWVSAIFDDLDLRAPQMVNGQPVLLINYMSKQWDRALIALNAL